MEYDLKTLTARIEPIMLVVVAGMVLLLALGIFLPMWGMLDVAMIGVTACKKVTKCFMGYCDIAPNQRFVIRMELAHKKCQVSATGFDPK